MILNEFRLELILRWIPAFIFTKCVTIISLSVHFLYLPRCFSSVLSRQTLMVSLVASAAASSATIIITVSASVFIKIQSIVTDTEYYSVWKMISKTPSYFPVITLKYSVPNYSVWNMNFSISHMNSVFTMNIMYWELFSHCYERSMIILKYSLPPMIYSVSTVNYTAPTMNYLLSTFIYIMSSVNYLVSFINYYIITMNYFVCTMNYVLSTMNIQHPLFILDYQQLIFSD